MSTKQNRPKLTIRKFDDAAVDGYIEKLDDIQFAYPETQEVLIHIDSYGGAVYSLLMLLDRIEAMPNPIVTYTSSKAMSCGAYLLAMAGSKGKRFASKDSTILVHEMTAGFVGDIKDIEDRAEHLKELNARVLSKFAESIGLRNARSIRKLIKENSEGQDLILTAAEAKKYNIIDEVATISIVPKKEWIIKKTNK